MSPPCQWFGGVAVKLSWGSFLGHQIPCSPSGKSVAGLGGAARSYGQGSQGRGHIDGVLGSALLFWSAFFGEKGRALLGQEGTGGKGTTGAAQAFFSPRKPKPGWPAATQASALGVFQAVRCLAPSVLVLRFSVVAPLLRA